MKRSNWKKNLYEVIFFAVFSLFITTASVNRAEAGGLFGHDGWLCSHWAHLCGLGGGNGGGSGDGGGTPVIPKKPFISIAGTVSYAPYSYPTHVDAYTIVIPGPVDNSGNHGDDITIYVDARDFTTTFWLSDLSADLQARKGGLSNQKYYPADSNNSGFYDFCDGADDLCLEHDWTYGLSADSRIDGHWRSDQVITGIQPEQKVNVNPVMTIRCSGGPTDPSFCGQVKPYSKPSTGISTPAGVRHFVRSSPMICHKGGSGGRRMPCPHSTVGHSRMD